MDKALAATFTSYGGFITAIIGLSWMIWSMSGKEEAQTESEVNKKQLKYLGIVWTIFVIVAVVSFIAIGMAVKKTGVRGAIASFLVGVFVPVFIASLKTQALKKAHNSDALLLTKFAAIPLAGIGMSLLFAWFVTSFYGIQAVNLWLGFIIGTSIGAFAVKLTANLILSRAYVFASKTIESTFLIVNCFLTATILAVHHFTKVQVNSFIPVFMMTGLFVVILVCTAPVVVKPDKKIMKILPAILAAFLALFLGITLFLVLRMNLKADINYPIIAGAITSIVFIISLYGSAQGVKGVDLSIGALGSLIIVGGMWFSYKWAHSLGIIFYSVGAVSVAGIMIPFYALENFRREKQELTETAEVKKDALMEGAEQVDENASIMPAALFMRAIALVGLVTLLWGLFRVYLYNKEILGRAVNIGYGDVGTALFVGILVSLCFEGFNLQGPNIFQPSSEGSLKHGVLLFTGSIIAGVLILLSVGLFYRLTGLAAFILGLSIPALLGVFSFFAQKTDKGLYRASLSTLWIAAAAYANFLTKYRDVPDQLTRFQKQEVAVGMILLIIVVYFMAHYQNRGKEEKKNEENKAKTADKK